MLKIDGYEDYKFGNLGELLVVAKSLPSTRDQIELLLNYFLYNSSYDYESLIFSIIKDNLFTNSTFLELSNKLNESDNVEYAKLNTIIIKTVENNLNFKDEKILTKYLNDILAKINYFYINNQNLNFIDAIKLASDEHDHEMIQEKKKENTDGLVKIGSCIDFSHMTRTYLSRLNIPNEIVIGSSHVIHEWNYYLLDDQDKMLDITDAIFARDNVIQKEMDPYKWINMNMDDLFKSDSNRIINIIGDKMYYDSININNYEDIKPYYSKGVNR